ncbi:MAG TPA: alanine--tRNA ligase [Terriglobales bacterium]|nr:alanine--tRNA ligase [Terriglobales bacterium]
MTGAEIRSSFLEFFRQRSHEVVPSASLVPYNDPTLMFTNAGMVPFKDVFLGKATRKNPRAVDVQRCLRLSGKHNDLEEVGRDGYHHTLFEMLGNWSFGDYYKRDAIIWAWQLLTEVWKLPRDKLYATVYRTDDEAEQLWWSLTDITKEHVLRFDEKDNFWEMGDVGPCGPCSEIHIDRGEGTCDQQHVAGHVCGVNVGCARYMELWNLVFIQYNRQEDGSLQELSAKHVDTGAGLERIASVMQNTRSNYDTDLFRTLIDFTEKASGRSYGRNEDDDLAFRVIADHSRAITFLIADGVQPSNEGRGYVLRRVLRRAARHARQLGFSEPILCRVSGAVIDLMGPAYPEIVPQRQHIHEVIRGEEERFSETLDKGMQLLDQQRDALRARSATMLPGDVAFKLYDTYGFPLDMTQDILREQGLTVDEAGFQRSMEEQRKRGRDARRSNAEVAINLGSYKSRFVGDRIYEWQAPVSTVLVNGEERDEAREGDEIQVIVPETPFYGESGGQVGDRGVIETDAGDLIEIVDAIKPNADLVVHVGKVIKGRVHKGERVYLRPDAQRRDATRLNHSATHVLHAALRHHLGEQVRQAGSLVTPDRLRFDFNYNGPVSAEVLQAIEDEANQHIRANDPAHVEEMGYDDALKAGALAFFGDKYGDVVRVIKFGDYSTELCGGTHVQRAGDIGVLRVRSEAGVAAGVRRIEAVTGAGALQWMRERDETLRQIAELVKSTESDVSDRVEKLLARQRELERQLEQLSAKVAGAQSGNLLEDERYSFTTPSGIKAVVAELADADSKRLLDLSDQLRQKIGSGVIVLASGGDGKVNLLAAVTKDLTAKVHAGKLIGQIAPTVGGRGGGRPELAQAGGKDASKIADALREARVLLMQS